MASFDVHSIEARWRDHWAQEAIYRTPIPREGQSTFYCLDFFPYPSGDGLSVGHGRNYVPSDVISRYRRMRGDAVLHPMGWDAFGLPAENEAIARGVHPAESTARYAANYRQQLRLLGCSYDWEREINSSDPEYYRWTQWFFLLFHRRGLAYRAQAPVNWCLRCQTVLADEEIEGGTCWRCHEPVVRRSRSQWFLRTTAYADELLSDLQKLDWPEHIVAMQRHWIGRSEGVELLLPLERASGQPAASEEGADGITIFTTRPDTLFGATFVALAPEHPLAPTLARPGRRASVQAYIERAGQRSNLERHNGEPDGVPTGAEVMLPPDGRRVPVFVADYVLGGHGTGAIMGVPAHDTRDYAFARRYGLPVPVVIAPPGWQGTPLGEAYTGEGTMTSSGRFDGLPSDRARREIARWLQEEGGGRPAVHYRLRDWLVSRQRYWGAPIPIVHCPACGPIPVPEDDLPVRLPPLPDHRPRGDGRAPLANVPEFFQTTCPGCGRPAERETDTLTGFVCSSWYFLRFVSPHDGTRAFDPAEAERWLPADIYVGGEEHAVGHLLYARFWTKVLADAGLIGLREPFPVLRSQGVLHVRDPQGARIERMSKSRGNTVSPESVIARYGADATRLHLMFIAPFEANAVWEVEPDGTTPQHIEGVRRFLQRVWRLSQPRKGRRAQAHPPQANAGVTDASALQRSMHRAVRDVATEIEAFRFNTAISALMAFSSALERYRRRRGDTPGFLEGRRTLVLLLAPLAPFQAEEMWNRLGEPGSVHRQSWPTWDQDLARPQEIEIVVQVNGRLRDRVVVSADAGDEEVRAAALALPRVQQVLGGAKPRRVIVVPGRVINVVT